MPVREYPNNIENPFGINFTKEWQLWKDYRLLSHKFKYLSIISEQMALKHLVDLSDGIEDKAIKIIHQSIRMEYKGFFPLRQTTNGENGKSGKKSGSTSNEAASGSTLRDKVQAAVNKRYGSGEQSGDEPYLKAV